MSENTPVLSLPLIAPSQAQKHVTHNEALMALDSLSQIVLEGIGSSTPPSSPGTGQTWAIGQNATGAWNGYDGFLATYDGTAWVFFTPQPGFLAWDASQSAFVVFEGSSWSPLPLHIAQDVELFGLNTVADAANPFSARVNKALWTAEEVSAGGTGDIVLALNRETSGAATSIVFQTSYSTNCIFGLQADNNLRLRVSEDGNNFDDALVVNTNNGVCEFPNLPRFHGVTNYDNYFVENTWAKVGINSMEYNAQNSFDPVTNLFTAPEAGTYAFGGTVLFKTAGVSVRSRIRLVKNGEIEIAGSFLENSSGHITEATATTTNILVSLAAGETVELQYRTRGGDAYCMADRTAFWGYKVG